MALLGAAFQIGRSALATYQAAIAVTGQNIANLGNPDYARQTARLEALYGGYVSAGVVPGLGVGLSGLRRHVDEALEARLRLSNASRSGAQVVHGALSQTETLYNELTDQDISTKLSEFFSSFAQLQTNPRDSGLRSLVIAGADSLVAALHRTRSGLLRQVEELNGQAEGATRQATQMAGEIAKLNVEIARQEADGRTVAGALRDRRDTLLRDLGELMDVQVREQENGLFNVYVGSEPLVQFDRSRGLTVQREQVAGVEIATVRFADNGGTVKLNDGLIFGITQARDVHLRDQLDRLDRLAGGLIYEVNRIHSSGVGLVGYGTLTGLNALDDATVALNDPLAGLPFTVQNGTLIVNVRNQATGQITSRQIEIDLDGLNGDDTSLADLAAALDAVPGLSASVTADRRLQVTADAGNEFWFTEDSSGVLAALGVGALFAGTNAGDIDVAAPIRDDPRLIAASLTGGENDGDNAGRLARLADSAVTSALLNNLSIQDFHEAMIGDLAVEAATAQSDFEAADAVYNGLVAQREAVSGVNVDEEAINLMRFETAYQGAARYVNVLDQTADELLRLL